MILKVSINLINAVKFYVQWIFAVISSCNKHFRGTQLNDILSRHNFSFSRVENIQIRNYTIFREDSVY